jgi:hypothetical protein
LACLAARSVLDLEKSRDGFGSRGIFMIYVFVLIVEDLRPDLLMNALQK